LRTDQDRNAARVYLIADDWPGQLSADNPLKALIHAPLTPRGVSLGVWLYSNGLRA